MEREKVKNLQRRVFVVTGNTGTGKTTVTKYLNEFYEMPKVITHTTRPPREGEEDGVDYYFESNDSFDRNHFLEEVSYSGYKYGSSVEGLERAWEKNQLITIVLDPMGAVTYLQDLPEGEVVVIYLDVSERADLLERLEKRGDDVEAIAQRLNSEEYQRDLMILPGLKERAHVVMNDDWDAARSEIDEIVQSAIRV
ncbi:Gmk_1 protein [Weissella ceti]|uniref:Gmk_1 protein n=1 Tax=Weissella ceti TaxID=759620 RepID=A0A088GP63_9LACO|nr:guanylate kinase [Weissella ceti]AIM62325.1 Gmk_1 protein [Weissella ceti]AIM63664.1 Gmk_1 protein [Weissella ceti]